ncbi:MotA/TolQ/ExbB proton channel family protein [bacterium]|nr:MotA/TolQ/ExbB proton channel family protein [bacterium]
MKRTLLILALLLTTLAADAAAQDIREALQRARADREQAQAAAAETEQRILADRDSLSAAVADLEVRRDGLQTGLDALAARGRDLDAELAELEESWSQHELDFREISGNVRVAARDLETVLRQSYLTDGRPDRLATVSPLLEEGYFPDIDDISAMAGVLFDEARRGGEVALRETGFTGRDGERAAGRVLTLGKFTAAYDDGDEYGFLRWSVDEQAFVALPAVSSRGLGGELQSYMRGESETVPVDISGGAALRQAGRDHGIVDQIREGGPLVWPILAIALAALIIVIERFVFLRRVHGNTNDLMDEVHDLAGRGDWPACETLVETHRDKGWPVVRVLRAGLASRTESRETLESVMQESILHELPRLERALSVLSILGAVAPLLGLLGTVTGMITTFRVITMFGTSDPRLMSGGISEALVTTELGLAVAIPVMLLHTLLSRRVDHIVGEIEEKAVQLTNLVMKAK